MDHFVNTCVTRQEKKEQRREKSFFRQPSSSISLVENVNVDRRSTHTQTADVCRACPRLFRGSPLSSHLFPYIKHPPKRTDLPRKNMSYVIS
jgi:hypothetical protein